MGILDTLFGGTDDSAQDAQIKANRELQQYIEQQAKLARGDAYNLYPASQDSLAGGYQSAIDTLGGTLRQQIDTGARGNYFAQEALLAGMPQYQNAILGNPVNNSALQPKILHPERNLEWLFNAQLPARGQPSLGPTSSSGQNINFTPGQTSNAQLLSQAYNAGLLGEGDYNAIQQSLLADPSIGPQTNWGSAGSTANLLGGITGNVSPEYLGSLTNAFNAIYGGA